LCEKNLDGFLDYIDQTGATICGRSAIGVLLAMLPADTQVRHLHYETSGRMVGDWSSSVSYCAFAVSGKWPPGQPAAAEEESADLSPAERADLLRLARATLTCVLEKKELPAAEPSEIRVTPAMRRPSGAFVTLHKSGQLRGCIGEVVPTRPLYKCVMAQAVNAGLNDHRFPPVELPEMDAIDMEISVLTPLRPVASIAEIEIGRHGVVLKKGDRGALFLPQVATEQGWDLETTLAHLSQKAGLPEDAWREGASFEVFEAIVFGEKEPRAGAARAGSK
jgi:AmmeMemoRadiSam system protein A